jgi:hypothetical protein
LPTKFPNTCAVLQQLIGLRLGDHAIRKPLLHGFAVGGLHPILQVGVHRLARRHLLSLRLGDASILDGLRQCCRLSGCLRLGDQPFANSLVDRRRRCRLAGAL